MSRRQGLPANGDTPVQRMIDTTPPADLDLSSRSTFPTNGFSGSMPGTVSKDVLKMQSTTSPADPPGMSKWKDKGYLADPSKITRKQALTRMHAVRGQFGGPSAAKNMFLGTALSNNFNSLSHFSQVEQPLENYLKGGPNTEKRAFSYTVTTNPGYPAYMAERINSTVDKNDKSDFTNFAIDHIPNGFTCHATLYRRLSNGTMTEKSVSETVATDVGAPAVQVPQTVTPLASPSQSSNQSLSPGNQDSTSDVSTIDKVNASASESGIKGALGWGTLAGIAGWGAAALLSWPVGLAAGTAGLLGAIYGYATAEDD